MTNSVSPLLQGVLGVGHVMDDINPTPTPFRQIPEPIEGTAPVVPHGAEQPTVRKTGKIPQPV